MSDKPVGVHLVGSVGLDSTEEVLTTVSRALGAHVRRMPDGETGPRSQWIGWQLATLTQAPDLVQVPAPPPVTRFGLRDGADASGVDFGDLGYAREAIASYEVFRRLRDEGVIPAGVRFQVALPTPFAGNRVFVRPEDRERLMPAFDRALRLAVSRTLDAIHPSELAFQWDVCLELGWWERPYMGFSDDDALSEDRQGEALDEVAALGELIPGEAELGYHLCYGDWGHVHFVEPADTRNLVTIANGLGGRVRRPVQWIHLPVPKARDDDAYYEPLRDLALRPETELYLGLVHYGDGVAGAERRIAAARRHVPSFGVATECGLGRRPDDQDMLELLGVHRAVAQPVREPEEIR